MATKEPRKQQPLNEDRIKGSYGIGIGMFMFMGLGLLLGKVHPVISWILLVPALAVFVPGCVYYAKSKGYPKLVGLLGFGAIPGLVILILLPDRTNNTYQETMEIQRQLRERHEAKKKDNSD